MTIRQLLKFKPPVVGWVTYRGIKLYLRVTRRYLPNDAFVSETIEWANVGIKEMEEGQNFEAALDIHRFVGYMLKICVKRKVTFYVDAIHNLGMVKYLKARGFEISRDNIQIPSMWMRPPK